MHYIVEEMRCCKAHESDSILELMMDTDRMVLINIKQNGGVVVPLEELYEAQ